MPFRSPCRPLALASALFALAGTGAPGGCGSSSSSHASVGDDGGSPPGDGGTASGDGGDAGSHPGSDAAGDAPTDVGVNPNPTISSWLGTNMDVDLSRVDVTYMLSPFTGSSLDANGYPAAGTSGTSSTDVGYLLPSGTYDISFVGSGTLAVSGIGKLGGAWQTVSGEQRNTVTIAGTPGAFGSFLTLAVTNTAGQSVTGIHILMPGFDYDTTTVFLPQFLSLVAPFRSMRFMGWMATNGSTLASWSDRPASAHFGHSAYGEPYEHMVELANETGKDLWVNIPEHATTAFVTSFADFCAANLDFKRIGAARAAAGFTTPFQLLVENSNETWNTGFTAYATFLAAASANPAKYTGSFAGTFGPTWMSGNANLMKVAQYEADRLVQIAQIFRTELTATGHADIVAPVLSGWALGPAYSDEGLSFIKANYSGAPSQYVSYVAMAPYFGLTTDSDSAALGSLFTDVNANIAAMDTGFQDFQKLATQYGVKMAAYEGGQSLTGTTNQPVKHLSQHDERMYEAYKAYLALWRKDFGPALFMHFDLAGDPGLPENIYQYGYWGSIVGVMENTATCEPNLPTLTGTETIASVVHHCPKYRALAEAVPQ
ncbi:MAG TPA: hypothetical protein VIF09_28485 [Polyangiaceae bacterium]